MLLTSHLLGSASGWSGARTALARCRAPLLPDQSLARIAVRWDGTPSQLHLAAEQPSQQFALLVVSVAQDGQGDPDALT